MNGCTIGFDELLAYSEGSADATTAGRVHAHVGAGCARCATDLEWIVRMIPALREAITIEHEAASRHLDLALNRVRVLFDERFPQPPTLFALARLVFDSRVAQAPVYARGAAGETCQLLFSTNRHNVEIWEERQDATHCYVIGQVLPIGGGVALAPREVNLVPDGGDPIAAEPYMDEFHAPHLPVGRYAIRIRMEDGEIVIPEIELGAG